MPNDYDNTLKMPDFQKIKLANSIAIGGMIGAGKSTLTRALGNFLKADTIYELNEKDELQNILLKRLYEGDETAAIAFQVYFFCLRFENYKKGVAKSQISIFDRTIFEDRLFAHQNMISDPIMFGFYDAMWNKKVQELIYSIGLPKLYVILDLSWDEFKERIFKRSRKSEIENFEQNESYFHSLNSIYVHYLKNICKVYGMNYIVIDSKLPTEKQVEKIIEKLKKDNLIKLNNK